MDPVTPAELETDFSSWAAPRDPRDNLRGPGTVEEMYRARAAKAARQALLARVRAELSCTRPDPGDSTDGTSSQFTLEAPCDDPLHGIAIHELPRLSCVLDHEALRSLTLKELLKANGHTPKSADALLSRLSELSAPDPGASSRDIKNHRANNTPANRARWTLAWLTDNTTHGRRQYAWIELTAPPVPLPATFPFVASMIVRRNGSAQPETESVTSAPAAEAAAADEQARIEAWRVRIRGLRAAAARQRRSLDPLEQEFRDRLETTFQQARAAIAATESIHRRELSELTGWPEELSMVNRQDPYYLYDADDSIGPLLNRPAEHDELRRQARLRALGAEYVAPPRDHNHEPAKQGVNFEKLLRDRELFLRVAAAIHAYRTINEQQIHAVVGHRYTRRQVQRQLDLCFEADLVMRSRVHPYEPQPRVYSPLGAKAFTALAEAQLSRAQIDAVLGGATWTGAGTAGRRHDLIATELLLRAAEVGVARGVLAEIYATRVHLAGNHPDIPGAAWIHGRADGVIIRKDGLPIAIELTANINQNFRAKVETWIAYLRELPRNDGGADVLFVVAPSRSRDASRGPQAHVDAKMHVAAKAIAETIRELDAHDICDRIGLVAWTDWFPTPTQIRVDAFHELRALTLHSVGYTWTTAPFGDPGWQTLSKARRSQATLVAHHAAYLGQTPAALAIPLLESHRDGGLVLRKPWQVDTDIHELIGTPQPRHRTRPGSTRQQRRERLSPPRRLRALER